MINTIRNFINSNIEEIRKISALILVVAVLYNLLGEDTTISIAGGEDWNEDNF